jgi:hypothetical protein
MRKLIVLSLMLGTMIFVVPSVEAKATVSAVTVDPQIRVQIGNRNRRGRFNRTRTVTSTRTRWVNGIRYRETIRTTYFANGRTRTVVVNRVRLGGRRVIRNY